MGGGMSFDKEETRTFKEGEGIIICQPGTRRQETPMEVEGVGGKRIGSIAEGFPQITQAP